MQTECNPELFDFAAVKRRAVVAGFDGGAITSDGGALLLRAADRAIGLLDRFAGCFIDRRRSELVEHAVRTLVGQRVFGIALGYEDLNCMAGKIFINYRRGDDPGFAQLLYRHLERDFAATNLFMDVEGHIRPGDDFVAVLRDRVQAADVMLAIIGPRWSELLIARGKDPHDFVAIEIETALENNKLVIPILVGGARIRAPSCCPRRLDHSCGVTRWNYAPSASTRIAKF